MSTATLELASQLVRIPSITPKDLGCQDILCRRLERAGFRVSKLHWEGVDNFWAEIGDHGPTLCFAGHTDVVPIGDEKRWHHPPFAAVQCDHYLHGRGAADMKGSLAAMICAAEEFVSTGQELRGKLAFLITSDEEGAALYGTRRVMQWLAEQDKRIDWCVIGEPSSTEHLGDVIKNGRRGSLNAWLTVQGKQGHVAYPHLADNPIHKALAALDELAQRQWDQGNEFFPPTSFQISNVDAGTGATNVIPGELKVVFNFRYSSETTSTELMREVELVFNRHQLDYSIDWQLSGEPFLTEPGVLTAAVIQAVEKVCARTPQLSTTGGTSDGRFIAPSGAQVVEVGPINATIHKLDECVSLRDLAALTSLYRDIMEQLLAPA